jgi:uncharacterized protein involved in exopolysaccharide biosynthesis
MITGVFVVVAIITSLMATVVYTSRVTMLPQGNQSHSDLWSQFQSFTGFTLQENASYELLYGEILFSDRILDKAIEQTWTFDGEDGVSLFEVFLGQKRDSSPQSELMREKLKKILRSRVMNFFRDERTGYMFLEVTAPEDPHFAADLANFLAFQLDQFNGQVNSQIAREKRDFIANRLGEVSTELGTASDALTEFVSENRGYNSSPMLRQSYEELEREVQAQTSIWIELRKQLELAKIDINNEMRSVVVLDEAVASSRKSGPNRTLRVFVGGVIGLIASFLIIFMTEIMLQARRRLREMSRLPS